MNWQIIRRGEKNENISYSKCDKEWKTIAKSDRFHHLFGNNSTVFFFFFYCNLTQITLSRKYSRKWLTNCLNCKKKSLSNHQSGERALHDLHRYLCEAFRAKPSKFDKSSVPIIRQSHIYCRAETILSINGKIVNFYNWFRDFSRFSSRKSGKRPKISGFSDWNERMCYFLSI